MFAWACSGRGSPEPATVAQAPAPPVVTAAPPACTTSAYRYALVAPLYSPVDNITSAELAAMRAGTSKRTLGPRPTTKQWAIVPAHELEPDWHVITVDGIHPLDKDASGPLVEQRCGEPNIDPSAITTVAMTGTTAMARFTAALMDKKGVTYPARDVAPWFAAADFVHVSNEASFTADCEPTVEHGDRTFCSRDSYIELLAALHVNIVELTGSHLIDFGLSKLRRSIEMYEARGWKFFGGGRDQIEATRPLLVEHNGNKLAFLGCNKPRSENTTIVNGPNVAFCDMTRLEWQVRDLRAKGYSPIVSIQHNEVRFHAPPHGLVRDFRRLARAGAAAVLGSQAHVAHPFETHAGAYVHFGLGNFIFDQPFVHTRDGVADRLYFHKGTLLTVRRLYTRLEEQGRPRPLADHERAAFLRILADELPALPRPRPVKTRPTPAIPDSFLVGKQPIYLWVSLDGTTATVSLREKPRGLRRKRLEPAVVDFIAAKYGIDRHGVTFQ